MKRAENIARTPEVEKVSEPFYFRTNYPHIHGSELRVQLVQPPGEERIVQQNLKDEVDINNIIARFKDTGSIPQNLLREGRFGDFSTAPTFFEAMNIVAKANQQFGSLSARVRERFGNDPHKFLAFMQDSENVDEMAKLGLMEPGAIERVKAERAQRSAVPAPETEPSPAKVNPPEPKGSGGAKPKARQED